MTQPSAEPDFLAVSFRIAEQVFIVLQFCTALAFVISLGIPVSAWALGGTYVAQNCADGCTAQDTLIGVPILPASTAYCNNGHGGIAGIGTLNWCTDMPGVCGPAKNGTYSSAPHTASYLCDAGTPANFTSTATGWSWTCGSDNVTCSASSCAAAASAPTICHAVETLTLGSGSTTTQVTTDITSGSTYSVPNVTGPNSCQWVGNSCSAPAHTLSWACSSGTCSFNNPTGNGLVISCGATAATTCSPAGSYYQWNGINWDDYNNPSWSVPNPPGSHQGSSPDGTSLGNGLVMDESGDRIYCTNSGGTASCSNVTAACPQGNYGNFGASGAFPNFGDSYQYPGQYVADLLGTSSTVLSGPVDYVGGNTAIVCSNYNGTPTMAKCISQNGSVESDQPQCTYGALTQNYGCAAPIIDFSASYGNNIVTSTSSNPNPTIALSQPVSVSLGWSSTADPTRNSCSLTTIHNGNTTIAEPYTSFGNVNAVNVTPAYGTTVYTLTCSYAGNSASQSITVNQTDANCASTTVQWTSHSNTCSGTIPSTTNGSIGTVQATSNVGSANFLCTNGTFASMPISATCTVAAACVSNGTTTIQDCVGSNGLGSGYYDVTFDSCGNVESSVYDRIHCSQ